MMRYPLLAFNAGVLSPHIDARSDLDKYHAGCRILDNMIPRIYGTATRRPGTKYIETCGGIARLIPFIYSNSIAYTILLEDLIAYFYYNGGQVLDGVGARLDLVMPYAEDDLFEVQYKQLNDVMWLTHQSYAQRKLSRTSATEFDISTITFTKGPFKTRNDVENNDSVKMAPSVTTGTGTLTATGNIFDEDHVGALFYIIQPRVNTEVEGSKTYPSTGVIGSAILVEGSFTFTTHGTWTGTVVLERSIDNSTWETYRTWKSDADRNVQYTGTEEEDGVYYRIKVTSIDENSAYGTSAIDSKVICELTVNSSTQKGICRVTGYTSAYVVSMTVLKDFASTDADVRWAEGCWSDYRGYPACVTFFEDRAVYGGTPHQPQTIWLSASGDYENFEAGVNDDDSFSLTMASDTRNAILWISALEALIVGTAGGEWRIRSSSTDEPLTPTNFSFKQQTSYGSKAIQALPVNDVILFADFVGRKIREATYNVDKDKYVAPDLCALAEHITASGITSIAYQKNPDTILWCTLDDGSLISMTYDRTQDVVAWAPHPLGGTDAEAKSVSVIPGATEDEISLIVERTIDGSTVKYYEIMQPRDVTDQEDMWFVDSGLEYDSTATTSITGLDHLEGETVAVWADGGVGTSKTVSSGAITLDTAASHVIAGLPYRWQLKPMRLDVNARGGTTKGSIKRISEIVISFYRSLGVSYGVDTDNLFTINFRTTEAWGSPPTAYTGDKVVAHEGGFDVEDSVILTGNEPTPVTIRAMVPRIEMTGR